MPFYKVPTTVDSSQETKRVRAILRQPAATDPAARKMAVDTYTKMADAPVNRINDQQYVEDILDSNTTPKQNGTSRPETIVEKEIRLQNERELELSTLRDALYKAPSARGSDGPLHQEQYYTNEGAPPLPKNPPPGNTEIRNVHPTAQRAPATSPGLMDSLSLQMSRQVPSSVINSQTSPIPKSLLSGEKNSPITYEEAISSGNHRGESLIAREIREHQEREEELRKQWNHIKSDSDSAHGPYYPSPSLYSHIENNNNSNKPFDFVDTANSIGKVVENQPVNSSAASAKPPSNKVIVLPLAHHLETDADLRFLPQDETPIEREMRLARVREDALREQRGIPVSRYDESRINERSGIDVFIPHRQPEYDTTDHKSDMTMKKLASNRLHMEIQKEKQRELDLRARDRQRRTHARDVQMNADDSHSINLNLTRDKRKSYDVQDGNNRHLPNQFSKEPNTAVATESLIEKEMIEMQKREDELRKQREMLKPKFH